MKVRRGTAHCHRGEIVFNLLQLPRGDRLVLQPLDLCVNRHLNISRCFRFLRLTADVEHTGILSRHLMGEGRRGHFVAKHERLVQPTGASGQHRREYLQGIGVGMPRRRRVPQDVHLRIGLRLGIHSLLNFLCHFLGDDLRRIALTPRDALEVALAQLGRLVGLEVADQNQRDVLRRIVQCVKLVSLRLGDGRDIRRPADHWPAVRMRLPEHRLERFLKFAKRRGLGAHAALLEHHVALGVKLAEHRP